MSQLNLFDFSVYKRPDIWVHFNFPILCCGFIFLHQKRKEIYQKFLYGRQYCHHAFWRWSLELLLEPQSIWLILTEITKEIIESMTWSWARIIWDCFLVMNKNWKDKAFTWKIKSKYFGTLMNFWLFCSPNFPQK